MFSQTTTEIIDGREVYRKIPKPFIPTFPVMSWAGFFSLSSPEIPSLYQSRSIRHFTAARYALLQAINEIGVKESDEILVPAYHCKVMVYPILDAGCVPVFYKIKEDFSIDIDDLEDLISYKSKAVIAVNYFGFIQNINDVRKTCDKHGLKLIEDCAHSLFGSTKNVPVGQTGDYAIGSPKKFFPVNQGGILTSNNNYIQKDPSKKYNLRSEIHFIYNMIEKSLEYGRLWIFKPFIFLVGKLRGQNKQDKIPEIEEISILPNNANEEYSPEHRGKQPAKLSIFLEKHISHHRIFIKRRENYNFLVKALKNIQNITIPITEIPAGTVPYMLPIIIKNLEKFFPAIEDEAIPFQRFGQFLWQGSERCSVSQKYAATILQLPCHQEMSEDELEWIVNRLHDVMDDS